LYGYLKFKKNEYELLILFDWFACKELIILLYYGFFVFNLLKMMLFNKSYRNQIYPECCKDLIATIILIIISLVNFASMGSLAVDYSSIHPSDSNE